ncbi:hypothetical protein BC831DRAFT_453052 [Entophlyctis helioformis]|nr:hypothetical protein BC831DRAFT_453052 [Entophlyctis helioformis]
MPKSVVVVGAGVAGLSAAWFLKQHAARHALDLAVTVVERAHRIGGWVQTERSSSSPSSSSPIVVYRLGLESQVQIVPKTSVAAKNRFVYFDGRLNMLPSSLAGLLTSREPVLKGILASLIAEPFRPRAPGAQAADESIAQFVERRLGRNVADNLVSAIVHGIYAGNIDTLSVRSTLNALWKLEHQYGSITAGVLMSAFAAASPASVPAGSSRYQAEVAAADADFTRLLAEDADVGAFIAGIAKNASIYSFKGGLQTLTDRLAERVRELGVAIVHEGCTGIHVPSNTSSADAKSKITLANKTVIEADRVVSAVPSAELSRLLAPCTITPLLAHNPSVTVGVVNLVYKGTDNLPVQGFGYLVPRSQTHTTDIIGCIFDSCALPDQATAPGYTRLTAMMGGHLFTSKFGHPDTVSPDRLTDTAVRSIASHLGIPASRLALSRASIHRDCIPQYMVGHAQRMESVHEYLTGDLNGRLSVVGSSYEGVGVNDCVHGSRVAATRIVKSLVQ